MVFILFSEILTLFVIKPHDYTFNASISVLFLFLSCVILYDFTYKRHMRTMIGVVSYGFTSVISLILSEAITLMYTSYLYPRSFNHHPYSNITALTDALVMFSGYGYPKVSGFARGIIILLMLYSWLVNVLLVSKLVTVLMRKLT